MLPVEVPVALKTAKSRLRSSADRNTTDPTMQIRDEPEQPANEVDRAPGPAERAQDVVTDIGGGERLQGHTANGYVPDELVYDNGRGDAPLHHDGVGDRLTVGHVGEEGLGGGDRDVDVR